MRIITVLCIALATALQAQVSLEWVAESSKAKAAEFTAYRGETLFFNPTMEEYGSPMTNYTATLFYQTNGMGSAWWQGTNGMYFTPAMDIGASAYTVYIRAEKTNGISYRANAVVRMLGSPGFSPNTIPLPVSWIDFASAAYTNAPWLLTESDPGIPSAVSNAVAQAGTNAQAMANTAQSNAVAIAGTNAQGYANAALSNAVAFSTTNRTTRLFNPSNSSEWIDGAGNKYVISNIWIMTLPAQIMDSSLYPAPTLSNHVFTGYAEDWEGAGSALWTFGWSESEGFTLRVFQYLSGLQWLSTTNQYVLSVGNDPQYGFVYITHSITTNLVARLATESQVTSKADASRTITVNGVPGTLTSNLTFNITGGMTDSEVTNAVEALRDYHRDSYTNVIWKTVYSNGWMWLVAFTNTPSI